MFVDESAVYLLPTVQRTYSPKGQTPVLHETVSHAHISAISGMTADGELSIALHDTSIRSDAVVLFLKQLMRRFDGNIVVVWDGASTHRSKIVREFLKYESEGRIHLERLPAYAPDLNPDEGVWLQLKKVELRNLCTHAVDELKHEVRNAIARIRRKASRIFPSFFAHAGLV